MVIIMKQIPVTELVPGMVTANDILTYDSKMIVPKDIVLTENIISRLESYSIYYVNIREDIASDLYVPSTNSQSQQHTATANSSSMLSNKEKLRQSKQFQIFCADFNKCAEHYKDNLMGTLYRNEPFRINELLEETLQLLHQDGSTINVFDMLLNMRNVDDSVYVHCIDVALISNVLAKWLHFSEKEQVIATACGLFHDIGKFLIPSHILRKPAKLTPEEFEIIKTHTIEGFHLLGKYNSIPKPVLNAALMHHEKCDGSGYPYGLNGAEIDTFSKVVTIADIFDAMTSERVYRKALCPFTVIKFFEDDGLRKYELKYVLTFLENVANSYLNHRVTLSNGMEGNVIFINHEAYSRPIIRTENNEIINLQDEYYQNILQLSNQKNVSIETII